MQKQTVYTVTWPANLIIIGWTPKARRTLQPGRQDIHELKPSFQIAINKVLLAFREQWIHWEFNYINSWRYT